MIELIDDRSSSTYSTDPDRRREPELRQVVQWLDRANCHPDDSAAVAQFDNVLPPLPPTRLDDDLEAVLRALPDSAPESSSTLAPPVALASTWAEAQSALQPVLIVATDGQLNDFDAAFPALASFPGPVYVLALGGPLPAEWDHANVVDGVTELKGQVVFGQVARSLAAFVQQASDRRAGESS